MKKKKPLIIIFVVLMICLIGGAIFFFVNRQKDNKNSDELVFVESVKNITGMGFFGDNRYMGIVESQEVKGVNKIEDRTVKTVHVSEGDIVKSGDPLFEYDTEEMTLKLKQMELELTSIYNNINTTNQQIKTLSDERSQVPAEEKIEYTSQIQNLQAQINQMNYDASSKQLEIERQTAAINNAIVYSDMDGIIKKINNNSNQSQSDYYDYYDQSQTDNSFIQIMALGDYRIKVEANELNVRSLYEGAPVIVRSRANQDDTWSGVISVIDLEHPVENNNNDYYMESSGGATTKYPFYIELESIDGLMLGQHVYVEMDYGQGEVKEGIWLDEFYIMQEDGGAYVWAADKDDRIEKRKIELGEYDEEMMRYQVLSGLSESDLIAFPQGRIKEGMKITQNFQEAMPFEMQDMEGMFEDGMIEDGMFEDGMMEDGMFEDGIMEDGMLEDNMMEDVPDTDNNIEEVQ